jgi:benzoyl-CoA reductase/2-hydroxyglutaryl-CoA dehydratase subunit BcrC/BadD/HgdB
MIGLTATIPLEILIASNRKPHDLNRLFLSDSNPQELIEEAELAGFPKSACPATKGVYGTALRHGVNELIVVTGGACGNIRSLMDILALHDMTIVPFSYPQDRSPDSLAHEIKKLAHHFNASPSGINQARIRLNAIRTKVHEIDRLCWQENKGSGAENHHVLLATSDMKGDPDRFEREIDQLLGKIANRKPRKEKIRLAYLGIPPLWSNLYETFEGLGGRVVYNEFPHQTSMPDLRDSLVEQYCGFTPHYDIFTRLAEIERQLETRQVHGIIHSLQSPCTGQVEDLIFRQRLKLPLLTLCTNRLGPVDNHTRMQIADFTNRLQGQAHN